MRTRTLCVLVLTTVGFSAGRTVAEVKVGDAAPAVSAKNEAGKTVDLKDYRGKKIVVLYFYPKDFTYGCTLEARKFAEDYGKFTERDAVVIGVSKDPVQSHKDFCGKYELPFTLLADENGEIAKAFGVGDKYDRRSTFVIDKNGKVVYVIGKVTDIPGQNEKLLGVLDEQAKKAGGAATSQPAGTSHHAAGSSQPASEAGNSNSQQRPG